MAASTQRRARGSGTPPLEDIVTAALASIDVHGLDRFSISALAAEMGAIQPNMYRRISSRRQLLDLVVDRIMSEAGLPDLDPTDWHAWLADWGVRVHRAWHAHPGAAGLVHHGGAQSVASLEAVLGVFVAAFPKDFVAVGLHAYLAHVFGTILLEGRRAPSDDFATRPPPDLSAQTLRHLADHATIVSALGSPAPSGEQTFLSGLTLLLDGFRPHAQQGRSARR